MSDDDNTLSQDRTPGETSVTMLPRGTRLQEFEVTGVVGEGGFGIVYEAMDTLLKRRVAIKEYMPSQLASRVSRRTVKIRSQEFAETFSAGLKSFINEARMLAQFKHPALVEVFRFWEENGTAYMAMPLYDGLTLKHFLSGHPEMSNERWLRGFLAPVLDALEHMHGMHVYHRDIAPDNLLILKNGAPLLLDLGAARRVIGDMTQALTVILKPGYAPIEQYADDPAIRQGPWTDIYALAAVVYFAITRKAPPPAVSRMIKDPFKPLAELAPAGFSADFIAAVDRGLLVRPELRPQTIDEFRTLLGVQSFTMNMAPSSLTSAAQAAEAANVLNTAARAAARTADRNSAAMGQQSAQSAPSPRSANPSQSAASGQSLAPMSSAAAPAPAAPAAPSASVVHDDIDKTLPPPMPVQATSGNAPATAASPSLRPGQTGGATPAQGSGQDAQAPLPAPLPASPSAAVMGALRGPVPAASSPGRAARPASAAGSNAAPAAGSRNARSTSGATGASQSHPSASNPNTAHSRSPLPIIIGVVGLLIAGAGAAWYLGRPDRVATDPAPAVSANGQTAVAVATPAPSPSPSPPNAGASAAAPAGGDAPGTDKPAQPPAASAATAAAPASDTASTAGTASAPAPMAAAAAGSAAASAATRTPAPVASSGPGTSTPAPAPVPASPASGPVAAPLPATASAPAAATPAAAEAPIEKRGTLRLSVRPWGEVFVDGASRGVSPPLKRLTLAEGTYKVEVRNPAGPSVTRQIEIRNNQSINLEHQF
jgi:serine/threonine protein kinase